MSFLCRLCGLTVDEIPEDAIQCGKLYRFTNGEYHDLRKKLEPRNGLRPRKNHNPEPPLDVMPVPMTTQPVGTHARDIPDAPEQEKKAKTETTPPIESLMERAFRLAKT